MKKAFLTFAAIYTICTANHLNAQIAMNDGKQLTSLTTPSISSGGDGENVSTNNVNLRAVKDFKKNFAAASNENWAKVPDGFIATFGSEDVQTRVAYNKKGNWIYTIRQYFGNKLPANIVAEVEAYYKYTITNIEEVQMSGKIVYLVHMYDATTWKIVRVCDGEIEVVQDRDKA